MKMNEIKAAYRLTKKYTAMGTPIELTIFGSSDEKILDGAFDLILYYEDLFTVNRMSSELMDVNHAAGIAPVAVSEPVFRLTEIAIENSLANFGFNATIGPLVKLWRIGFADARLPRTDEIDEKRALIRPEDVVLDADNFSIFLKKKQMELDLGAIAKGYIADRIKDYWQAYGIASGIVNLGGNLLLIGQAPHHADKKWRVGVRNPFEKSGKAVLSVLTTAKSFVTSGISERNFEQDGKVYHHIIDPKTGYPHDNSIASVTVLTDQSMRGELESTRLFFADATPANYPYAAIVIHKDYSVELINLPAWQIHIKDDRFYLKKD